MLKIKYDYRLFSLLNFLGAAILNFMTCNGCLYCYSAEVHSCETTEQPYYFMKFKMAASGKAKIGDNQIMFCPTLKCYFHVDCIFNNLTLIRFESGGFI